MTRAQRSSTRRESALAGEKFALALVSQLVVPAFVLDAEGRVALWNEACESLTGMPGADVIGTREHWRAFYAEPRPCLADVVLQERYQELAELYPEYQAHGGPESGAHAENWCLMPLRGVEHYLALDARPIRDQEGGLIAVVETLTDETARHQAESRLHLIASVFESSQEGILITAPDARILDVNAAFTRLTGYERDEVIGKTPAVLKSGLQDEPFYRQLWQQLRQHGHWQGEIWDRKKSGEVFPGILHINAVADEAGKVSHYIGMFLDISDLKSTQQRLASLASYDALTELPNRDLLVRRLHQAMARARRLERLVAVCSLDLDAFKRINDTYGQETGNRLLVRVANRLRGTLRADDTAARLGGDEFVLLITDLASADELEEVLDRVFKQVSTPYQVGEHQIGVSASIGVTLYPFDDSDPDTLLRHADHSMYLAKQLGRNRYQLFDMEAAEDIRARHRELERLRGGLQDDELRLFYQPKVDMRTGQVIGLEALIRWQQGSDRLLGPLDFLPLAESSPLIVDIGDWVLHEAMAQMSQWRRQGLDLSVSVNIAARHFQRADFLPRLERILREHSEVPPDRLELEILESTALKDVRTMRELMAACQAMGVRFALDDFGTGYSSLSYLKQLPAETLKIDRSFVRDMLDDQDDLAIIEGVIGLAGVFRKEVIAEGVETAEHGLLLMLHGCGVAQGFEIARPMPARHVSTWIESYEPDWKWTLFGNDGCRRQDMPLMLARYDYARLIAQLIQILEECGCADLRAGRYELPTQRLAAWVNGEGRRYYGRTAEFRELGFLHHELLRAAARLGESVARDPEGALQPACATLRELERGILSTVEALQRRAAIP